MLIFRLVLLLVQLVGAFTAAPYITRLLPKFGQLDIFVYAIVVSIIVWLIGLVASMLLKDIAAPSSSTLTFVVILACVGAALTFVPAVKTAVGSVARGLQPQAYPLIGAVLGYILRR